MSNVRLIRWSAAWVASLGLVNAAAAASSVQAMPSIQPMPDHFGRTVRPALVSHTGDVGATGDTITLHRASADDAAPTVLLDYGRDIGGQPLFQLTALSGHPALQALFSESQKFLLPAGDGASGFQNAPSDPSRADVYFPQKPGLIENPQVQGGERFEQVSLLGPGSVTLSLIGIRSLTAEPTDVHNTGHFESSDPRLNEIWSLGARSLQLCEAPAHSMPPLMKGTPEGAEVATAPIVLYQFGGSWQDYTATVQFKIVANEASFVVRGNYVISLRASDDRLNAPNSIQATYSSFFGIRDAGHAALPAPLAPGQWHTLTTRAIGNRVEADVDGTNVFSFPVDSNPTGSVGFASASGAKAIFRHLVVAGPAGQALYTSTLAGKSVLVEFAAGTNELPIILDGAKRDRIIWLGDLGQSASVVYYSSGESRYVKGSLSTFASFASTEGEVSTNVTPTLKTGLRLGAELPTGAGFFSLPYSIYFLDALQQYVLYTGDTDFAREQWPVVQGELAYLRHHLDQDGLLVTDPGNGMDWSIDDNVGSVSEYNTLYAHALHAVAALSQELGMQGADELNQQADAIAQKINQKFFNRGTGVYDLSADHRGTVAQDTNALAVLYGVAPVKGAADVLHAADAILATPNGPRAFSDGKNLTELISPFISGYEVDAYFSIGDAEHALGLIRQVWGRMGQGSDFYTGATQEALSVDGLSPQMPSRTVSHAWSGGPTYALSAYVLGVRPLTPGYQTWIIEPQLGDLSWARGDVPTPRGPIHVGWSRSADSLVVDFKVLAGSGTLAVPVKSIVSFTRNGSTRAAPHLKRSSRGYLEIERLPPGHYHLVASL